MDAHVEAALASKDVGIFLVLQAVWETIEELDHVESDWSDAIEKLQELRLALLDELASLGPSSSN